MDGLKGKMMGFITKYKDYIKVLENKIKKLEDEKNNCVINSNIQ
jgi:hypothetical protein